MGMDFETLEKLEVMVDKNDFGIELELHLRLDKFQMK